jgi:hypothetical protein
MSDETFDKFMNVVGACLVIATTVVATGMAILVWRLVLYGIK